MTDGSAYPYADFLARVHQKLATMTAWDPILEEPWTTNADFLRVLLAGVDAGWTPSSLAVEYLILNPEVTGVVNELWDPQLSFRDDAAFLNTRFALLTAELQPEEYALALGQVRRMFAAGRADIAYLRVLPECYGLDHAGEFALYLAHDDELAAGLADMRQFAVPTVAEMAEYATQWISYRGLRLNVAVLVTALSKLPQVRAEQFRDRWLPPVVSASELAEVRNMSAEILRNLYPQVWADGYAGYRARVQAVSAR